MLRAINAKLKEDEQFIFISAVDYSKPTVQGGEASTAQERYAEFIEQFRDRTAELRAKADKLMREVFRAEDLIADNLSMFTPLQKDILIDHYMLGKTFKEIAEEKHYSEDYVKQQKAKAIKKIIGV